MLQLPALLDALIEGTGLSAKSAPLLGTAEGQQALGSCYTAWLEAAKEQGLETAGLAPGHGPALLGFAAAVSLVQSLPDSSGQSVNFNDNACQTCPRVPVPRLLTYLGVAAVNAVTATCQTCADAAVPC